MKIINAAVILLALRGESEQTPFVPPRDRAWYERFFFDPCDGVRAYYDRVSNGDVLVHGRVLDWLVVNDLNWDMNDVADRQQATQLAIKLHEQRGTDFSEYNLVALMVFAPPEPGFVVNDGSSNAYSASGKRHHAILARDGAGFDFIVHEVGHGLDLDHSCGNDPWFKTPYGQPTEYGHPFCVMSAQSYGGRWAAWVAPTPGEPRPEYVGRCPFVNAATTRALGWIDAHIYNPLTDGIKTFDLTNLELARKGGILPPAVQVTTPQGVFVIEYRGPASWDLGQKEAVIIVNHGQGSTADAMHPRKNAATYLGHIAKGFNPSRPGSVVNTGAFAVELADIEADFSKATVRLTPGHVGLTPLKLTRQGPELVRTVPLGEGSTTFAPGERLCISGTWDYEYVGNLQKATFKATWARARAATAFTWKVGGKEITNAADTLPIRIVVKKATPKFTRVTASRTIQVAYEVESIPNGSRLKLWNRTEDETYELPVVVEMKDTVARADAAGTVTFTGAEYLYPPEFYRAEEECIKHLLDPDLIPRHVIVVPWDIWPPLERNEVERVHSQIAILEQMRAAGDTEHFRLGLRQLASDLGITIEDIKMVPLRKASSLSKVRLHEEPPASIG